MGQNESFYLKLYHKKIKNFRWFYKSVKQFSKSQSPLLIKIETEGWKCARFHAETGSEVSPAPSTQNKNEKDPTIFPFQIKSRIVNHQFKLKRKTMQDYSLLFFSTFPAFLFLLSLFLVSDLWVKVAKNVVWGSNELHSWQLCFLGHSTESLPKI